MAEKGKGVSSYTRAPTRRNSLPFIALSNDLAAKENFCQHERYINCVFMVLPCWKQQTSHSQLQACQMQRCIMFFVIFNLFMFHLLLIAGIIFNSMFQVNLATPSFTCVKNMRAKEKKKIVLIRQGLEKAWK
jgi:hypothetical protein